MLIFFLFLLCTLFFISKFLFFNISLYSENSSLASGAGFISSSINSISIFSFFLSFSILIFLSSGKFSVSFLFCELSFSQFFASFSSCLGKNPLPHNFIKSDISCFLSSSKSLKLTSLKSSFKFLFLFFLFCFKYTLSFFFLILFCLIIVFYIFIYILYFIK